MPHIDQMSDICIDAVWCRIQFVSLATNTGTCDLSRETLEDPANIAKCLMALSDPSCALGYLSTNKAIVWCYRS